MAIEYGRSLRGFSTLGLVKCPMHVWMSMYKDLGRPRWVVRHVQQKDLHQLMIIMDMTNS